MIDGRFIYSESRDGMTASSAVIFSFENCSVDVERRELRRAGTLLAVEPQVFDLLTFLIQNRQRVVSREELIASVWHGRLVSESTINTRINAARAAVGDSGSEQRIIKTVIRKGVRFAGQVSQNSQEPVSHATVRAPNAAEQPPMHERVMVQPVDLPSIAVLPFRNLEDDRLGSYFGDGIVEDMITSLANLRELFVISRGSTVQFRDRDVDPAEVGRTFGVRYIVNGSVGRVGKRLRTWVELQDADTGRSLWSDKVETGLDDLFAVQDHIVENAVARIAPHVREQELRRALRKPPETMGAYEFTLQALDLIYRLDRTALQQAGDLLARARAMEPAFSLPYTWGAWAHLYRIALGWSSDQVGERNAAAEFAAAAARLDDRSGRALATYGHMFSFIHHDYDTALYYLDSAIKACPNDPLCWALLSASLSYVGRTSESVRYAERALRLSPIDRYRFYYSAALGLAHYVAGDYEQASKWGLIAREENPRFTPNLRYLAAALAGAKRTSEAQEVARALMRCEPEFSLSRYGQAAMPLRDSSQRRLHLDHLRIAGIRSN